MHQGTHCVEPPVLDTSLQLERNWDGNFVDFHAGINYTCIRGQKFKVDFYLEKQNATCRPENKWDVPPTWFQCVESKILKAFNI